MCGDDERLIFEMRSYHDKEFLREAMSDGVVTVGHSTEDGNRGDQIFLSGPNL